MSEVVGKQASRNCSMGASEKHDKPSETLLLNAFDD